MKGVVNLGYDDESPVSAVVELVADAGGSLELVLDVGGRPELVVDVRGESVGELERVDEVSGLGGIVVAAVVKVDSLASLVEVGSLLGVGRILVMINSGSSKPYSEDRTCLYLNQVAWTHLGNHQADHKQVLSNSQQSHWYRNCARHIMICIFVDFPSQELQDIVRCCRLE
ncbi:MAG: hypothetical protein Q9194_006261 [Teloschistes cf. exilis]